MGLRRVPFRNPRGNYIQCFVFGPVPVQTCDAFARIMKTGLSRFEWAFQFGPLDSAEAFACLHLRVRPAGRA
jgi:hypothetical protein